MKFTLLDLSRMKVMMKKRLLLLIPLVLLLLAACANQEINLTPTGPTEMPASLLTPSPEATPAAAQQSAMPKALANETVPCPVDLPEGDVEGATAYCGQITVPENWAEPEGRSITVSYAVFKATGDDPAPDPIVYFDGGPGQSTFGQLAGLAGDGFIHLREDHDLIFWEQRGNLYSSPLDCPDEVRDPRTALSQDELEKLLQTPQPTPDPALLEPSTIYDDPDEVLAKERALAQWSNQANNPRANCRKYYDEQGVDLTQYSTHNNLQDGIALMRALDYPEYNIYAISYGTTLALETLRFYDEHQDAALPAVRSVLIDGVAPLYVREAERALIQPYNVLRVVDDCAADATCAQAYPDIHQRLVAILAGVEKEPLILQDGTEITLPTLRSMLFFLSSTDPASLPYMPRLIAELEQGESATWTLLQARKENYQEEAPAGIEAVDLLNTDDHDAIQCNDRYPYLDVTTAFEMYRNFEAPQLISDPSPEVQMIITCEAWGLTSDPAPLPDPVTSGMRTLVSNGAMDSATAVEWGKVAYGHLPNAEFVVIPFAKHAASVVSECGKTIARAYFDDPQDETDFSCAEATKPVFILLDDALPEMITDVNP